MPQGPRPRLPAPRPRARLARGRAGPHARALAALPARALPAARRSLLAAGAALAVEYVLRSAARSALRGALARLPAPFRAASAITRTEITEWLIVERTRRR